MTKPGNGQPWGVTVSDVLALAPHLSIKEGDGHVIAQDPEYSTRGRVTTQDDVHGFIVDVGARVTARVTALGLQQHADVVGGVAADAVKNGAAAYLVDAVYPARSGVNDLTSYGQVLWARYREALEEIGELAAALRARGALAEGGGGALSTALQPSGEFPAPSILDAPTGRGAQW